MDTTTKLSRFVHLYENDRYNTVCLFQAVLVRPIYVGLEAVPFLGRLKDGVDYASLTSEEAGFVDQLLALGFAVDATHPEQDVAAIGATFKPVLTTMYLILTDECNLGCRYCFVEAGFPQNYRCTKMSWEVAKAALDTFIAQRDHSEDGELWLYGGEPLLNSELLFQCLHYITVHDPKLRAVMVTNGTLITSELAHRLSLHPQLQIAVSLDGPREVHDQMRITKKGEGSFDAAITGFRALKDAGCNVGVSCTLGHHNVAMTKEIAVWIQDELGLNNFGMNLLIDTPNVKVTDEYVHQATKGLIDYFQIAREAGVFESRIMRKVQAFTGCRTHWHDCAACGSQMVISPEGKIGICHEGLGERNFFMGSIQEGYSFVESPLALEWAKRSPANMEECYDCPALGICGGGCPYGAMLRYGSIWEVDRRFCVHAKDTLEWLIWDLHEKMQES